jgi:hypothetical protein
VSDQSTTSEASTPTVDEVSQAQDVAKAARTEVTEAKRGLREAKSAAKQAQTALTKAQKAAEGKEGDELKAANAAIEAAEQHAKEMAQAVEAQEGRVAELETAATNAKAGIDVAKEAKKQRLAAEREAKAQADAEAKTKRAEERAAKPKKAPLTLSQRRAVLKLAEGTQTPTTDMNRVPLDYLVSVGLARTAERTTTVEVQVPNPKASEEGQPKTIAENQDRTVIDYSLTDLGKTRAGELNPKWRTWKPASNGVPVVNDPSNSGDSTDDATDPEPVGATS